MQRGRLMLGIREAMGPCSRSPSDRGCGETRKASVDAGSKKGDCGAGNSLLKNEGRVTVLIDQEAIATGLPKLCQR
jgi:hypothetical protein